MRVKDKVWEITFKTTAQMMFMLLSLNQIGNFKERPSYLFLKKF